MNGDCMVSNWFHLHPDKLTKEEEDIHRLRHDLRKASISNQPCKQAPEVSHYHNPPHYSSFLPEHKDTSSLLTGIDPFSHVPLRTVSHRYHLPESQLSLPRMEATSSRSATPFAWLSEAHWEAAAAAVNVCVLLVLLSCPHLLHHDSPRGCFLCEPDINGCCNVMANGFLCCVWWQA